MDNYEWEPDALFDQAVEFIIDQQSASISRLQRQFIIGYNRAGRIIEQMVDVGLVSEPGQDGNRVVLFDNIEQFLSYRRDEDSQAQNIDMSNVILWPGIKK